MRATKLPSKKETVKMKDYSQKMEKTDRDEEHVLPLPFNVWFYPL